jgi:hypothetical protein
MKKIYRLNFVEKKSLACLAFLFSIAIAMADNPIIGGDPLTMQSGLISSATDDNKPPRLVYNFSLNNSGSIFMSIFQNINPPSYSINFNGQGEYPLELGMKFRSSEDCYIAGFSYYKGFEAKGEHIGNLWTRNGTLMASATFVNDSDSGWQSVLLSNPAAIQADSVYVVSYFSPHGDYVKTASYFTTEIRSGPLTALKWTEEEPNGVYAYSNTSTFPNNNTYVGSTNYWVDVLMLPNTTGIDTYPQTADGCFDVYPNPASGRFYINTNCSLHGTIRLLNITGKILSQKIFNTKLINIDCTNLLPGIYIVQIIDGETGVLTARRLEIR